MESRLISVSEFSFYVSKVFENEILLQNLNIVGEISSFNISGDIAYFQIKDTNALLQCILFNAKKYYKPNIGDKVVVTGSPNYYIKNGKFSFNCYQIKPYGIGDLYKQFEEMKAKLSKEGLFDIEHKKDKPKFIKNIGIVTSKQGAVIQDIINVSTRRDCSINIFLFPVKVQGMGAEIEISKGIEFFNNYDVDAVIVARGGGSKEDLAPFNSEIVARATYNSNKFIVSAVGHETDYTIIDYVSDLRAPTPSAAAELLTKDRNEEIKNFKNNIRHFYALLNNIIENNKNKLLSNIENLYYNLELKIKNFDSKVVDNLVFINSLIDSALDSKISSCEKYNEILEICNPKHIMDRGYAKIEKNNKVISSTKKVNINDEINIIFSDGKLNAIIKNIGGKDDI